MAGVKKVKILGLDKVLRNLNREIRAIESRTMGGMMEAGELIKREAQLTTPVDTGNLKASAYVERFARGGNEGVIIGYAAVYAMFVHEAAGKLAGLPRSNGAGFYWDPLGRARPQFLHLAIVENAKTVLEIIARSAQIEG